MEHSFQYKQSPSIVFVMNVNLNKTDNNDYVRGYKDGKIAGATELAGKTQDYSNLLSEMRDCLDAVLMINEVRPLQDSELIEDINNAIGKYKEVENEKNI